MKATNSNMMMKNSAHAPACLKKRSSAGKWSVAIGFAALAMVGCGKKDANFSILSAGQQFQQNAAQVNPKIDILWVVDNSGSMDPLQQNLIVNFSNFINNFQGKGFDYKMAVTTTDSYLSGASFNNVPSLARVRDGAGSSHTGQFFITPYIPSIVSTFMTNATQGSSGSGDERAFQSMLETLKSPLNSDFRRSDSFFAVIILSDEDDFTDYSRPELSWVRGGVADHSYTNPGLVTVDSVVTQLDQITNSTSTNRRYNVSSIAVLDEACRQQHLPQSSVTIVGQRYMDLANRTGGVTGSICDSSYSSSLNFIQQRIVELSTQFPLNGDPNPSTIVVVVDGAVVPQDATNGWTYMADANAIAFHGTAVPGASAVISVSFDPKSLR